MTWLTLRCSECDKLLGTKLFDDEDGCSEYCLECSKQFENGAYELRDCPKKIGWITLEKVPQTVGEDRK